MTFERHNTAMHIIYKQVNLSILSNLQLQSMSITMSSWHFFFSASSRMITTAVKTDICSIISACPPANVNVHLFSAVLAPLKIFLLHPAAVRVQEQERGSEEGGEKKKKEERKKEKRSIVSY